MLKPLRWPSVCQVCHAWPSEPVCASCVSAFAQPVPRCPTCALALQGTTSCHSCATTSNPLDACLAALSYGYPWADCVARFKFHADPGLGRHLAQLIRHAPWVEPALEAAHLVIPMPLSAQRLRERGFNQAWELARHLAGPKAHGQLLLRANSGSHQVGASRDERLSLADDVFWVDPSQSPLLTGARVVLLDDVMTTGATLRAAAHALRQAGAAHITGLVLARTEY